MAYIRGSMYTLPLRMGIRLKVPRPRHAKADSPSPDGLEKREFVQRLAEAKLKAGQGEGDCVEGRDTVGAVELDVQGLDAAGQCFRQCRSVGPTPK